MAEFRVGIIGCGRRSGTEGATGSGLGHAHARGYEASVDCQIVAAADINEKNLHFFCQEHHIPRGYVDYREMLAEEHLDIVSVCTWPKLHAPMVIDAAYAHVRAVHCEKPMAPTWGESRKMAAVCKEYDVQLTFNHQRRFGEPFRKAKQLLSSGAVGQLVRLEAYASNLYDWGTHWFDMMFFYNDEQPVEWVMGQTETRGRREVYGVTVEGQGLSLFRWRNGVYGLVVTGNEIIDPSSATKRGEPCANRLVGTDGVIEVQVWDVCDIRLRNERTGGRWQVFDTKEPEDSKERWYGHITAAILDLVDALKVGREPQLSARKALQATELIFATYESSRKRGRVELPLEIEDSPLLSMLGLGD